MDAQLVWDTWRRILTSDELIERVLRPIEFNLAPTPNMGLSLAEEAIVADYSSTPVATGTNIGMYRRGLVRNALAALSLVPLSRHLLYMSGLEVEPVAASFVRAVGYVDDGPNFWRIAGGFVAYLATLSEFAGRAHQDVLALDAATVALARRLGETGVSMCPENATTINSTGRSDQNREPSRFFASAAAVVVSSRDNLTPWLENPEEFDPLENLAHSPRHWLIFFPTADAAPAYAELSERTARVFNVLATPRSASEVSLALGGISDDEVLQLINQLAELGVIVREDSDRNMSAIPLMSQDSSMRGKRGHELSDTLTVPLREAVGRVLETPVDCMLANDAFVMLDPAVELLDVEVGEYQLLGHGYFEVGMAVPPGEGLMDFVLALRQEPILVGRLRESYDDHLLVDKMLAALRLHGFLHETSQKTPSIEELEHLRSLAAQLRKKTLRPTLTMDLDSSVSVEQIRIELKSASIAPVLVLRCSQLSEQKSLFAELARLRQAGMIRIHHIVIQTTHLTCDSATRQSLLRLGAVVVLEGLTWPVSDQRHPGLAEMTRDCVAVHVQMTPDLSILDATVRARALAWAASQFITGLCLRLDAEALWPRQDAGDEEFCAVFNSVRALEHEFGDVEVVTLPSDDALLGKIESTSRPAKLTAFAHRFRSAYIRWRLPTLKSDEGDNTWSQTPNAEEKVVVPDTDLLPNNPELLLLAPGSILVDVCGGLGRVARRLAPAVGQNGLIISIEMLRSLSDRARHVACERGVTNVSFRPGLAQRIPLPDGTADAAVNEWTGGIWELGLGTAMVGEMARVVRLGGRIAVTHRLIRMPLLRLGEPWLQYEDIYRWMRDAFMHPNLRVITERVWGQVAPSLVGEHASEWRKQYLPRLISTFDMTYDSEDSAGPHADVFLTIVAERQ